MNHLIIYSLETAISLALFYTAYWLFLRKETFFKLNRFYLLASAGTSLLLPLLNIGIAGQSSLMTKYFVLPVERYEQSFVENMDDANGFIKNKRQSHPYNGSPEDDDTAVIGEHKVSSDPAQANAFNAAEDSAQGSTTNWLNIALITYFIGGALLLIRFVANLAWIFSFVVKHRYQQISGIRVIRSEKNLSPFSFLNFIFMGAHNYSEDELNRIISHEKVHIRQKHTADLVLFELLLVFQWFNPFVWFYKRAVKITHEYLADEGTLNSGVELPAYQYSLLHQALRSNNIEIASNYNLSIKKRIDMMKKKRSPKASALKLALVVPVLMFLFGAFAFKSNSAATVEPNNSTARLLINDADTAVKNVKVPLEYLRQLEGVYVATNEPGRNRKIRFVEVLGSLIGNDDGYIYKINPIGLGSFINPDDNATLVFDTQNKEAITLLLFGRVNLKKVSPEQAAIDFPKKSVAYALADVMEKDNITTGLARYQQMKDSAGYDLSEAEMNYTGYQFLLAGRGREAAAIFELNTQAFPNSFNVYDSYGEALMAVGDKAKAIENYKKSVQLNPGSVNGLKVLKAAGVNTDALVTKVKVPVEELRLLAGKYVSTNEPNLVRKIRFTEENGVLAANDRGYKYKLLPMGQGKFINPDDGASFVFDTKDKKAVSLLLFGKINLKKLDASEDPVAAELAKKVKVSADYLKLLEGEYISTNQPNRVRTITFTVENGLLTGTDNGYRYQPVPVGEGKFINPDDDASLVFDTKDKNVITLILAGKINLKKVK